MKVIIKPQVGLGQTTDLDVDPKELVKNIKERAAVSQAVDANSVVLSYEGNVLDDKKRLKEFGVSDGSTLNLLPRHQKGGSTSHFYFYQNDPLYTNLSTDFNSRMAQESKMIRSRGLPIKPLTPRHWIATIEGRGKWRGKIYHVEIKLPQHYPYSPPKVVWKQPMKPTHPNIFTHSGWVCLSILKRDWRSEFTLITVYEGLEWLLENPHYESVGTMLHSFSRYARRFGVK